MIRAAITVLAIVLPAATVAEPQRVTEYWMDQRPQPRRPELLRSAMMVGHNEARRQYGVAPLVWDEGLAGDAQAYAEVLARTGRFEHDPQRGRDPQQGENLWMGTRTVYSYETMISDLVEERRYYRPGRFPDVSRTGDWSDVGHYTQIIWPTSRHVGCAMASNASDDYLVCRYSPAGNVFDTLLR
jgi:hypothetical protein